MPAKAFTTLSRLPKDKPHNRPSESDTARALSTFFTNGHPQPSATAQTGSKPRSQPETTDTPPTAAKANDRQKMPATACPAPLPCLDGERKKKRKTHPDSSPRRTADRPKFPKKYHSGYFRS